MPDFAIGKGDSFVQLANDVSDAMARAMRERGMSPDQACAVVACVAADHTRMNYGDGYLLRLAQIIVERHKHAKPLDAAGATLI
jgi:hypothetical protein